MAMETGEAGLLLLECDGRQRPMTVVTGENSEGLFGQSGLGFDRD